MKSQICIIGAGNLGLSLANGLVCNPNFKAENLSISRRNKHAIEQLVDPKITLTTNNLEAISNSEIIIIAVKPYDLNKVLKEINPHLFPEKQVVVSVATGISITEIRSVLNRDIPIFRAMPNTAADTGQSLTCIATDSKNIDAQKMIVDLFDLLGKTIIIQEELMNAATVLGACGIAYALRFIRSMTQGGIQIGFDSQTASEIVNQVIVGAATILQQRGTHPEQEIDKVTTPKGCTIFGLNEMEHNGFSSSLIRGIETSFQAIRN